MTNSGKQNSLSPADICSLAGLLFLALICFYMTVNKMMAELKERGWHPYDILTGHNSRRGALLLMNGAKRLELRTLKSGQGSLYPYPSTKQKKIKDLNSI